MRNHPSPAELQRLLVSDGKLVVNRWESARDAIAAAGFDVPDPIVVSGEDWRISFGPRRVSRSGNVPGFSPLPQLKLARTDLPPSPLLSLPPPPVFALTPEVTAERLAVCATCPAFSGAQDRCNAATCKCSWRQAAAMPWTECPKALWPVVPAPAPRTVDTPQSEEGPK